MKTFRVNREKRPPEPFAIEYEVEIKEKVEVPVAPVGDVEVYGADTGPVVTVEERGTGVYEWKSRTFGARYSAIPAGLVMAASEGGPGQIQAIREILESSVVEKDEILELLRDRDARIPLGSFIEIFEWLVELSSGRPTPTP